MSSQYPPRPRPTRHPFAASAPVLAQQHGPPPPSSPPPSYTPKDMYGSDPPQQASQPPQYASPGQPLAPASRRNSQPGPTVSFASSSSPSSATAAAAAQSIRRRSSAARILTPEARNVRSAQDAEPPSTATSARHPRVAVLLGIKESFHVPLLLCRALATGPAIWWFGRCGWLFLQFGLSVARGTGVEGWADGGHRGEETLVVTEVFLAMLWCTASGYLSFYFADSLMSRWLLNYTPSATLVRLFTISAVNVYTTSWWLHLSGASRDPRLLLPAWFCIASTLTILYHLTHRHVNIRRETRAAVRAFYVSSTISLWGLLLQSHLERGTWKTMPLVGVAERVIGAWRDAKGRDEG